MNDISKRIKSEKWLQSPKGLMLFSTIDSVAICLLAWFIYSKCYYRFPRYVVIGLIFAATYFILSAVVICWLGFKSIGFKKMLKIIPLTVMVFILSGFLQWIYSLNISDSGLESAPGEQMASSYVFIVDDSGSTDITDPNIYRYVAISSILLDKDDDFQYMVYSFASNTICTREMAPKGKQDVQPKEKASGGTNMRSALQQAIADYKNGKWKAAKKPEVILISDGYAGDINSYHPLHTVLNDYISAGIAISTVGFADCDSVLMNLIAESTGGVFVDASDAYGLFDAMRYVESRPVKEIPESRDLLSFRLSKNHNMLYCIERIIFLSLIALIVFRFATIPFSSEDSPYYVVPLDYIKIAACVVLFELGVKFLSFPLLEFWLLLFILCFGLIKVEEYEEEGKQNRPPFSPDNRRENDAARPAHLIQRGSLYIFTTPADSTNRPMKVFLATHCLGLHEGETKHRDRT